MQLPQWVSLVWPTANVSFNIHSLKARWFKRLNIPSLRDNQVWDIGVCGRLDCRVDTAYFRSPCGLLHTEPW